MQLGAKRSVMCPRIHRITPRFLDQLKVSLWWFFFKDINHECLLHVTCWDQMSHVSQEGRLLFYTVKCLHLIPLNPGITPLQPQPSSHRWRTYDGLNCEATGIYRGCSHYFGSAEKKILNINRKEKTDLINDRPETKRENRITCQAQNRIRNDFRTKDCTNIYSFWCIFTLWILWTSLTKTASYLFSDLYLQAAHWKLPLRIKITPSLLLEMNNTFSLY